MVESQDLMRIGELARRSGVSTSRIRFYETAGLLRPAHRTNTRYRIYGSDAVRRLGTIRLAQIAGFSLSEIAEILPPEDSNEWDRPALLDALSSKVASLRALQERLDHTLEQLLRVQERVAGKPTDLACDDNLSALLRDFDDSAKVSRPVAV